MRVISGFLKGRIILGDKIKGTRPTMDKIKESLFAIIQNNIKDSICLDLFAGSGSLGIEAISNGAKFVYFVDKNKIACETIKKNINNFNILSSCQIINNDYKKALINFSNDNQKFNLIFLDPPYNDNLIGECLEIIDKNNLLSENGQVICEFMTEPLLESYGSLKLIKTRKYGDKNISIYSN